MSGKGEFDETFVFLEAGSDAVVDRVAVDHAGGRTLLVWAPSASAAAQVAAELAEGGVRLIELYRGFDLTSATRVIEAVGGRAPVGVAGYGFGASPERGQTISRSATIYANPEADPAVDRVVKEHRGGGRTTVVAAPDASSAAKVAVELVEDGAELVEICGGTPLTTAEHVRAALKGRVPVSLVSWPFESIDGVAAYKAAFEASVAYRPVSQARGRGGVASARRRVSRAAVA